MALAAMLTQTLIPGRKGGRVPAAELLMVGYGARHVMPAYIGVNPSKSMYTKAASGSSRYQFCAIAFHGFGHWSFGKPMSPRWPASRWTIQKAVT